MHQSVIRIGPAPLQAQPTSVIYKVATQSLAQDYAPPPPQMKPTPTVTTTVPNAYPVMDATVASSVKGEPELNIGKHFFMHFIQSRDNWSRRIRTGTAFIYKNPLPNPISVYNVHRQHVIKHSYLVDSFCASHNWLEHRIHISALDDMPIRN